MFQMRSKWQALTQTWISIYRVVGALNEILLTIATLIQESLFSLCFICFPLPYFFPLNNSQASEDFSWDQNEHIKSLKDSALKVMNNLLEAIVCFCVWIIHFLCSSTDNHYCKIIHAYSHIPCWLISSAYLEGKGQAFRPATAIMTFYCIFRACYTKLLFKIIWCTHKICECIMLLYICI